MALGSTSLLITRGMVCKARKPWALRTVCALKHVCIHGSVLNLASAIPYLSDDELRAFLHISPELHGIFDVHDGLNLFSIHPTLYNARSTELVRSIIYFAQQQRD